MARQELALEFLKESFREEPVGCAKYCITVVHNAACDLPDLLSHFAHTNPGLIVKTGIMGHSESDIQTKTMVFNCPLFCAFPSSLSSCLNYANALVSCLA